MISDSIIRIITTGNEGFPLTDAYKANHRYYNDFINMMNYFSENLSERAYKDIEKKFLTGSMAGGQVYLQTVSELTVLYYILRNYSIQFEYEPKYNGNYNPECSFFLADKIINVEVKCPDMVKRMNIEQHTTLKLVLSERIPDFENVVGDLKKIIEPILPNTQYTGLEVIPRMDNKLKDFLESSQKKFPAGNEYFNILVITLDILPDVDEWYNYIFDNNGVFTDKSYIESNYNNVDSILLTTPVCGHRNWSNHTAENIWELEQTLSLLLLDPRKEHTDKGKFYITKGISIFGNHTYDFFKYLQFLDSTGEVSTSDVGFHEKYHHFKLNELSIVSNYINWLKENQ